jgi:hypothetical protein
MEEKQLLRVARILKVSARIVLLIMAVCLFGFSFLSGSESFGGGVQGILRNMPNTIPWAGLIVLVLFSWKQPLWGSILVFLATLFILYFFNFAGENFFLSTFVLSLLLVFLGFALMITTLATRPRKEKIK